jgi:hypothetical protein
MIKIMSKIIGLLSFLCWFSSGIAQIMVTGHLASPMNCSPTNVLSVSVQNGTGVTAIGAIQATLREANGQVLLVVRSMSIEFSPGTSRFNGQSILESSDFKEQPTAVNLWSHGQLLSGQYELCFEVILSTGEDVPSMCFPLVSCYSSFLQLVNPFDKEIVVQSNPILTWGHSGLLPSIDPLETFDLRLVEVGKDQNKSEAIAENPFVLFLPNIKSHSILYPIDAKELELGRTYAWQVRHSYADKVIEFSDVWEFTIQEWEDPRDIKYVYLSGSEYSDLVEVYNSLYVRFDERYLSEMVEVALEDANAKVLLPELLSDSQNVLSKRNGFNGYRINLSQYHLKAGYYTVIMWNAKGDKYSIKIHFNS